MWRFRYFPQWLNSNKQWIFQGIGVAVLSALAVIAGYIIRPYVSRTEEKGQTINIGDGIVGKRLEGSSQINAAVEEIAATGSKRIQLLIQVLGPKPHLPSSLAKTIAERISQTNGRGLPIKYDPVLVLDADNPPAGFVAGALERAKVFSELGVDQFVRPRYLNQKYNLGADILIVDRKHVLIALNTVPGADAMQVGFLFKDQPQMASEFADWFDEVLMPNSQYLDDWLRTNAAARPSPKN